MLKGIGDKKNKQMSSISRQKCSPRVKPNIFGKLKGFYDIRPKT